MPDGLGGVKGGISLDDSWALIPTNCELNGVGRRTKIDPSAGLSALGIGELLVGSRAARSFAKFRGSGLDRDARLGLPDNGNAVGAGGGTKFGFRC